MKATLVSRMVIVVFALYLLLYSAHALFLQKTVYGDGIFYFSWVHSIVIDHNIDFTKKYAHFGVSEPITPTNHLGNKHPIGAPLFWLPSYAQAHTIIHGTGYELPYQLLVGLVSVLAALSGLILLYRLLTQWFSATASVLAVVSIATATNLLFYGSIDPVNSHAISFFTATVFLSFLFSKNVSPFLTGCALGFCALVRPQDAVLGLLALPTIIPFSLKSSHLFKRKLKSVIQFLLGAILIFSLQVLAWYALYGIAFVSPYLTGGESFRWWSPHFIDVLFSPTNGFFLWTPMTLLAIAGFAFWKDARASWFLILFALEVAFVGSWSIWWQGASYSGRMLVSTLPLLAFGIAALYTNLMSRGLRAKQILLTIIGPLTIINNILIIRFLLQT